MGRMLFIIWAIMVTSVVTAINANIRDDDRDGTGSYRSWGSGSTYSGGGSFHK